MSGLLYVIDFIGHFITSHQSDSGINNMARCRPVRFSLSSSKCIAAR